MLRKLLCMSLIAMPAVGLSGCSSIWSGVGSFSNYMAEKTQFSSPLRKAKTQEVKFETQQDAEYAAATATSTTVEAPLYVEQSDVTLYSPSEYSSTETYTETPQEAPLFDSEGNYIGSPTVPCPDGTYLTADDTCMFLEQTDYSADFTQ